MNETLKIAWKYFLEFKSDADKLKSDADKLLSDQVDKWDEVRKLKSDADKLKSDLVDKLAEVRKLKSEVRKLKVDVDKLISDLTDKYHTADKLLAESEAAWSSGAEMWTRSVIQVYSLAGRHESIEWTGKGCKVNGVEYLYKQV